MDVLNIQRMYGGTPAIQAVPTLLAVEYKPLTKFAKAIPLPYSRPKRGKGVIALPYICSHCHHAWLHPIEARRLQPPVAQEPTPRPVTLRPRGGSERVIPFISRDDAEENGRLLAREIREGRQPLIIERRVGCFNCGGNHPHTRCNYQRGTFCGLCGEPGMIMGRCPRCYPEDFGIEVPEGYQPPGRRGRVFDAHVPWLY